MIFPIYAKISFQEKPTIDKNSDFHFFTYVYLMIERQHKYKKAPGVSTLEIGEDAYCQERYYLIQNYLLFLILAVFLSIYDLSE